MKNNNDKIIIGFALVLNDDNFIPGFSVEGKFDNVLQIHSDKKSAEELAKKIGGFTVKKCKIIL
jgi:hypothetical protein